MRLALLAVLALAGCGEPAVPPIRPLPPVSAGKVRVRVFTEPAAVRAVSAVASGGLLVASDHGLERWDAGRATAIPELDGTRVLALAADPAAPAAWLLSDAGLGRYELPAARFLELPPLPEPLAVTRDAPGSLADAGDGGVWLGTARGLVHASPSGGVTSTAIKEPVRALLRDRAGWLWIATAAGLVARKPSGEVVRVTAAHGCAVVDPRLLVAAPGDRVLVIGADDAGRERLAIGAELAFTTYRTLPDIRWDAATPRGGGVILLGGEHAYRVAPADGAAAIRPLARDGARMVPVPVASPEGGEPLPWAIDPVDLVLPAGATTLGAAADELLVGTRELGVARYREGDRHPREWLRARAMFADATSLSVACAREQDCWIATGARVAWRWTGERFTAVARADRRVLAVARDPAGPIYAIERDEDDLSALRVTRVDGPPATWTTLKAAVTAPDGGAAELAFARFAGPGVLWLGARGASGAVAVATVELASGKVTAQPDAPPGVTDADVRGRAAWLATAAGVTRLVGDHATTWTERDGLRSELVRAVAISPTGDAVIGTRAGVGVWDGRAWTFPPALRFEINDLVATRTGLWLGSERGLVAWDGTHLRRFDTLHGLAENEVLDVAADPFGRVWARGPTSLTLVAQ